ncbi:MAG TPA: histidine kinase [Casimicrobiaceae bacterium]|nr:histidine kinase [Casimicrobiaceae bacterium]
MGATIAIAVALEAWSVMDVVFKSGPKLPAAEAYLSATIIILLMAFSIMFTTLVADELVARGAKRLPTYAWAVVIGSAVATLAQWEVHRWLQLRTHNDVPGISHEVAVMQPAFVFFEYLIWGSIIAFIYVNRRTALLATARMNAAQVQRADAQRRTLESRLQALQARVEPQFLFNTLAQVRALYESDPAKGGQMLGDLIDYLRAALPRLRDSTSTLEREVELAIAYLKIMQVRLGDRLAFQVDVQDAVRAARMPPMLLLPLVDYVLVHGLAPPPASGTIRIATGRAAGKLRVEIADSGGGFAKGCADDDLRDIRERLHGLYGDQGTLAFASSSGHRTQAVLEIPYESTHRSHR